MLIGIAITRAGSVDSTWTTLHLAQAALNRGHHVRFVEPWDFEIRASEGLVARSHAFDFPVGVDALADGLRARTAVRRYITIANLDLLLLRSAPLDTSLLTFAMFAKKLGVPVVNDPEGLMRVSHKGWLAAIAEDCTPPAVVTRSRGVASLFYEREVCGVVVKPARGSGGRGVSLVPPEHPAEFEAAFDSATSRGDGYVVIQAYVAAAMAGEKRLVWLDGEVLGGYLRRRAPGEFRHNLKRGGLAEPTRVTALDKVLVGKISPALLSEGIRIAGLDIIGDYVIEVNALNPGGAYHTDRLSGTSLSETIICRLETTESSLR
ncbi:MAG: hypothetical protein HN348_00455, partial [Proteobacteria bacterium]|nr:hypothetical protein [Pseudomonadota bacterium]